MFILNILININIKYIFQLDTAVSTNILVYKVDTIYGYTTIVIP